MPAYILPDHMRQRLKSPFGRLIKNPEVNKEKIGREFESCTLKVAVGDATTETLLSLGFTPDIEVVDGREMRESRELPKSKYRTEIRTANPSGCLTDETLQAVSAALNSEMPVRILVDGEEDLLVLPILALYPVGTVVVYGQPRSGLVFLHLDEEVRKSALSILQEMGVVL